MRKKYHFVLEDYTGSSRIYGDAHTLHGVKVIFKKMSGAYKCEVYKRFINGSCLNIPCITYQKP